MASPKKTKTSKKAKAPSFEEALGELESMVETMEAGQLSLEKLIIHYERGASLISHCESVLNDARTRLDLITLEPKTPSTEDTTQDLTLGTHPASHDNNDDEIRLF